MMNETLDIRIKKTKELIDSADSILIGAGSGLSTAAGVLYGGEEFNKVFDKFIKKYGITDLYSSAFYPYKTPEEYWAYMAMHIAFADTHREGTKLYRDIFELVKDKNYFVFTTNTDHQFFKTGFDKDKIFIIQGDARLAQCKTPCHNKVYDLSSKVDEMIENTDDDLKLRSDLVPKCPVCGEDMVYNMRIDDKFVQDDLWYEQEKKYQEFLANNKGKRLVLLEFGAGFNTPGIIRFPFEQMAMKNENWHLIRFNKDNLQSYFDVQDKMIGFNEDVGTVINQIQIGKEEMER